MYIVADVGGTSARMELLTKEQVCERVPATFSRIYASQSIKSFESLLMGFISDSGTISHIDGIVCAIPGDVIGNEVTAMNLLHWGKVSGDATARALGVPWVILLNDFEAVAHILNSLTSSEIVTLVEGNHPDPSIKAIVGLGTGLGVAFATTAGFGKYTPHATEAGYIPFLELSDRDIALAKYIRSLTGSMIVAFEHVCSGSGLVNVFKYVSFENGMNSAEKVSAKDICRDYGINRIAKESCDLVLEFLGRFLSLLALIYKPTGGIYITGGAMDSLGSVALNYPGSLLAGLVCRDHPVLVDIARRPSIYLVKKANAGVCGAREFANSRISPGQ